MALPFYGKCTTSVSNIAQIVPTSFLAVLILKCVEVLLLFQRKGVICKMDVLFVRHTVTAKINIGMF